MKLDSRSELRFFPDTVDQSKHSPNRVEANGLPLPGKSSRYCEKIIGRLPSGVSRWAERLRLFSPRKIQK